MVVRAGTVVLHLDLDNDISGASVAESAGEREEKALKKEMMKLKSGVKERDVLWVCEGITSSLVFPHQSSVSWSTKPALHHSYTDIT